MKRVLALVLSIVLFGTACGTTTESQNPVKDVPTEVPDIEEPLQTEEPAETESEDAVPELEIQNEQETGNGFVIAIDAGHQKTGNPEQEPIGPGATETKAKVSSGTTGRTTGIPEYELTLTLSLMLQEELEDRGYTVVMTRTTHDVDLSNRERADIANAAEANAFLRIHANGSEDSSVSGAMTICQTSSNPYNGALYAESYALSAAVLDELVAASGCKRQYIWETDSMSGINWCEVPVTIVEVGYMTNPEEDTLLADTAYQKQLVTGIANGVDRYLAEKMS